MVAGRELNERVHVDVMGREVGTQEKHTWEPLLDERSKGKWCSHCGICWFKGNPKPERVCEAYVGDYSGDIAAAWTVVEKLKADGWAIHMDSIGFNNDIEGEWRTFFSLDDDSGDQCAWVHEDGDTAPHAICKTALAAVGALPEDE